MWDWLRRVRHRSRFWLHLGLARVLKEENTKLLLENTYLKGYVHRLQMENNELRLKVESYTE